MSIGEEQTECPLCMEPLELDDINFFPCTCGYQICRFCWHRIRTDENGLCPACRKQYPEDPAEFKPLTDDELQRIKKERRQKDLQRKQKAAESRKHLANVRVVQRNLVFVVGLSQRLADPDVLKKNEYFGKFGKIHKVVINHSTSYAGAQSGPRQGPSASAYVTYLKSEDALRAIQRVNHIAVDGRTLKASLGTTKYCSHFLRGSQCPKTDCMYLHELGEEAASFTKEEMQQGKHQEYEQNLYEQFMNSQNAVLNSVTTNGTSSSNKGEGKLPKSRKKNASPPLSDSISTSQDGLPLSNSSEGWPTLATGFVSEGKSGASSGTSSPPSTLSSASSSPSSLCKQESQTLNAHRAPGHNRHKHIANNSTEPYISPPQASPPLPSSGGNQSSNGANNLETTPALVVAPASQAIVPPTSSSVMTNRVVPFDGAADPMSLFANNGFSGSRHPKPLAPTLESIPCPGIPDSLAVTSTTDWQAAFGFTSSPTSNNVNNTVTSTETEPQDDDLGFDPWDESAKGLADLLEREGSLGSVVASHRHPQTSITPLLSHQPHNNPMPVNLPPPGFTQTPVGAFNTSLPTMGLSNHYGKLFEQVPYSMMGPPPGHTSQPATQRQTQTNGFPNPLADFHTMLGGSQKHEPHQQPPVVPTPHSLSQPSSQCSVDPGRELQDSLRALLPNINISFGSPPHHSRNGTGQTPSNAASNSHANAKWSQLPPDLSWDPAIVTSGHVTDRTQGLEDTPHWMASLQHLTDENSTNNRMPFMHKYPIRAPLRTSWTGQTQHPPPGFHTTSMRPTLNEAPPLAAEGMQ